MLIHKTNQLLIKFNDEEIKLEKHLSFLSEIIKYSRIINTSYHESLKMWYKTTWSQYYDFLEKISLSEFKLPRGLENQVIEIAKSLNIEYNIESEYLNLEQKEFDSKISKLREYQTYLEKELDKHNNWFVIVPTWWGKTIVMINEIVKAKKPTFVLVHNTKLLDQFKERLKVFTTLTDDDIGVFGKGKKTIKFITIWLVQSFSKLSDEEIQEITKNFDLFFIDETHHLVAETFIKVAKNIKSKRVYGLTATPYKKDGTAINFLEVLLWPLLYHITEQELVNQKVILKPKLKIIENYDSEVLDIFKDYYDVEGKEVYKIYASQILENKFKLTEDVIPPKWSNEVLLVLWAPYEIARLNSLLSENIKKQAYVFKWSIFKRNSSILHNNNLVLAYDYSDEYKRIDFHKVRKGIYSKESRMELVYKTILHEFKNHTDKNPYILVLNDQVEYLERLYSWLPESLKKYACLLHGSIKKKELEVLDKEIAENKYRIILATDKFVGEGWDVTWLNILILTQLMKDHEWLKQLVWRVIRTAEWKTEALVYDICDIKNSVTYSQFKKRLKNYYDLHCDIIPNNIK